MRVVHVLMVQSFGFIDEPRKGEGSVKRIEKAVELVEDKIVPEGALMIWPQAHVGHNVLNPDRSRSLGKNLADYCRLRPEFKGLIIRDAPMGWGTLEDIKNASKFAEKFFEGVDYDVIRFHFVSDPTHLKRIKLVWKHWPHPERGEARFYESEHVLNWFERIVRESIARVWYRWQLRTKVPKMIKFD